MKVFLRTFGCRANQYDSEVVRAMLSDAGVTETADASQADFAVFNSCTVTAAAEADLRSAVRGAARENPSIRTVVMGCAPGLSGRDERRHPLATLPNVVALAPGADVAGVSAALGLRPSGRRRRAPMQSTARAHLRIQDGCDEHCTFCATTIARGPSRSRPAAEIVAEAAALAVSHPEIVVTGIHIGAYGRDTGSSLGELMQMLVSEVPAVRFRLTSIEATEVDDVLARLLTLDPARVAPHLHAPLQSGSDRVLRRMGRNWYDAAAYTSSVRRLTDVCGVFALSADVIAGFPGESEADHELTVAMVEMLPFTSLHVFPYSPRPGTAAMRLGAVVPAATARRRAAELRALAAAKSDAYAKRRIGGKCDVVVTERGKGLTEDYLSVALADPSPPRRSRFHGLIARHDGHLTASPA